MEGLTPGALLVVFGGILNGSFTAPMKFSKSWAWENTWLVYSVIGLFFIPVSDALISVPNLWAVYRAASPHAVALVMLFGFGWGVGSVLFGLGIDALGTALGFPIILGLTAVLGSLIPLIVLSPQTVPTTRGLSVLFGLGVVVCGVSLCGKAGGMRGRLAPSSPESTNADVPTRSNYRTGLLICVGSGVFNSMLNLALAFGVPVAKSAALRGAPPVAAQNVIWALGVGAGSLANIGFSLYLLYRNKSWVRFGDRSSSQNFLRAALMGVLWIGGIAIYGAGTTALGGLGAIFGWPLFMSMVIIAGSVWGFATGEWNQASRAALLTNVAGIALLIGAIIVISIGSSFCGTGLDCSR